MGITASAHPLPSCEEVYPYALVQLQDRPGLYDISRPETAWGTPALIEAIESAALRMAMEYPEADPIYVGDISSELGGPLPPHRYHFDGRSADIGLYSTGGGQPWGMFFELDPLTIDLEKSWALIDSFLATGQVEHILLDQVLIDALKGWLLETGRLEQIEAARIFPPPDTERLWAMNSILRTAVNHKDHIHVRFRCK